MAVIMRAGRLIVIGLEEENVKRMQKGLPFHRNFDDVDVVVFIGKDVDTITKQIDQFIGPDTVVTDERNRKKN